MTTTRKTTQTTYEQIHATQTTTTKTTTGITTVKTTTSRTSTTTTGTIKTTATSSPSAAETTRIPAGNAPETTETGATTSTNAAVTGENTQTSTVAEVVSDTYEVTVISYDETLYYFSDEPVDDTYRTPDNAKCLGPLYHNGTSCGILFHIYNYKEQGQQALILITDSGNNRKLFLPYNDS